MPTPERRELPPPAPNARTTRVLFVCTGNVCRSPLAQVMAAAMHTASGFTFSSAGTAAAPGSPASPLARRVASDRGLDLSTHRATSLESCDTPDLVVGMEDRHLTRARAVFPDLAPERFRLLDPAGPIPDPYGDDLAAYVAAADRIERALTTIGLADGPQRPPGHD